MNDNFYRQVIHDSPIGYCYTKALYDEYGRINDYLFLEVNHSFECMTGTKGFEIVGKFASEIVNMINGIDLDLVGIFHNATVKHCKQELTHFSPSVQKWFRIGVYSPETDYFITQFMDLTQEIQKSLDMEKILAYSEKLFKKEKIDYEQLCENFLDLSNAKFSLLSLFNEKTQAFSIKASKGCSEIIEQVNDLFGTYFEKKAHFTYFKDEKKGSSNILKKLDSMEELVGESLPNSILNFMEKTCQLGKVIIVSLSDANTYLGEVILVIEEGNNFDKENVINMYATLASFAISKENTGSRSSKADLKRQNQESSKSMMNETESKYAAIFDQAPIAVELFDAFGVFSTANPTFMHLVGIDKFDEISKINMFNIPNLTNDMKSRLLAHESIHLETKFDFDYLNGKQFFQSSCSGIKRVNISISPITSENKLLGYVMFAFENMKEKAVALK